MTPALELIFDFIEANRNATNNSLGRRVNRMLETHNITSIYDNVIEKFINEEHNSIDAKHKKDKTFEASFFLCGYKPTGKALKKTYSKKRDNKNAFIGRTVFHFKNFITDEISITIDLHVSYFLNTEKREMYYSLKTTAVLGVTQLGTANANGRAYSRYQHIKTDKMYYTLGKLMQQLNNNHEETSIEKFSTLHLRIHNFYEILNKVYKSVLYHVKNKTFIISESATSENW